MSCNECGKEECVCNELSKRFSAHDNDFLEFERIPTEARRSNHPDVHLFIRLSEMFKGDGDLVSAAEHDEIYLSIEPNEFEKVATDDDIREFVRCGLRYDQENDSLCMFV